MRYFLLIFGLTIVAVMLIAGKRGDISRKPPIEVIPDMDRMPKLRPQAPNDFFADGMSSQLHVPGTIARGSAYQDIPANTGKVPGTTNWVIDIPVPVNEQLLAHGQERYGIYCAVCHSAAGDGKGITGKYGMVAMANFHDPRIVKMPDGEMFTVITYGRNLMGSYAGQIDIQDRWAIIAYVRALQRSRLAILDDVPADRREELRRSMAPPAPQTNAPAAAAPKQP